MRNVLRHLIFPVTLVAALLVAHEMLARGSAPQTVIVIWFGLMPGVARGNRRYPA